MMNRMKPILLLFVFSALFASNSAACSKPVFRYALERWFPTPYEFVVLHKGPIDDETRERLGELLPDGAFDLRLSYVDVEEDFGDEEKMTQRERAMLKRWRDNPDPARLPLAMLLPPDDIPSDQPVFWEGRIDAAGVKALRKQIYGPVVRQLLEKLATGDAAVWILVKGPDEAQNRQTRELLDKSLSELEKELKLPHEQDPTDTQYDDGLAPGIPMRMSFSVMETNLDDPANRLLKDSLMAIDAERLKQPGPKVIPVFGRCRALDIIHGDEIDAEILQDITFFLVGPCSCRVKELNPGFDLLAPFPWEWILYEETKLDAVMKQLTDARGVRAKTDGVAK